MLVLLVHVFIDCCSPCCTCRAIYDEGLGDPYGRNVGPEDPLPFQLESKDEQTELLALHHITQAAEAVR